MNLSHSKRVKLFQTLYPNSSKSSFEEGRKRNKQKEKDTSPNVYNCLYGEILREGLGTLFQHLYSDIDDRNKLMVDNLESMADLGCGSGKMIICAFLFYDHLKRIHGIELSRTRFEYCKKIVLKLASWLMLEDQQIKLNPSDSHDTCLLTSTTNQVTLSYNSRSLTITYGNLFDVIPFDMSLYLADFAFVDDKRNEDLERFVDLMIKTRPDTYIVTYESLNPIIRECSKKEKCFFTMSLPKITTTWGDHRFFAYRRLPCIPTKDKTNHCSTKVLKVKSKKKRKYTPW
jgi:hypothetical protein